MWKPLLCYSLSFSIGLKYFLNQRFKMVCEKKNITRTNINLFGLFQDDMGLIIAKQITQRKKINKSVKKLRFLRLLQKIYRK